MSNSTSVHGIRYIALGIVDDLGKIITDATKGLSDTGVVVIDGDGQGATTANVTNLEEAGTIQWANNKSKRVAHGKPQPQVALTMLDMPYDILQKIKGYNSDGKGGYTLSSTKKPHVAMLICSTSFDGSDYFEGFANGEVIEPGQNHGTDNTAEVDANTTLTYQSLAPIKDDVFIDNTGLQQPTKFWNSGMEGFDAETMGTEVFGGATGVAEILGTVVVSNETALDTVVTTENPQ